MRCYINSISNFFGNNNINFALTAAKRRDERREQVVAVCCKEREFGRRSEKEISFPQVFNNTELEKLGGGEEETRFDDDDDVGFALTAYA